LEDPDVGTEAKRRFTRLWRVYPPLEVPDIGTLPCPVKFMTMKSEAHFTGVAHVDGTGEKDLVSYLTASRFTLHGTYN
jgi:hypothetical protein